MSSNGKGRGEEWVTYLAIVEEEGEGSGGNGYYTFRAATNAVSDVPKMRANATLYLQK
jgi:hypothetical protein